MFIYLDSEAGISRMVDIESVIVQSLIYHLIDYIPFVDTETNKMLKSLLQVSVHRWREGLSEQGVSPAGIILSLGPK